MRHPVTLIGVALLAAGGAARADVIILKDGFTLHGRLSKERVSFADPNSGQLIVVAKAGGLNLIDDGVRRVVYPASARRVGDVDRTNIRAGQISFTRPFAPGGEKLKLAGITGIKVGPFDPKTWNRPLELRRARPGGRSDTFRRFRQKLTLATPYRVRMVADKYRWTTNYLTEEVRVGGANLNPVRLRALLAAHPSQTDKDGNLTLEGRYRLFEFFHQAKWFDMAATELDELVKAHPGEKKRVDQERQKLTAAAAAVALEVARQRRQHGQHAFAKRFVGTLTGKQLPAKVNLAVADLRGKYETEAAHLKAVNGHLESLPKSIKAEEHQFLVTAAAAIRAETNLDNIDRLEPFYALAKQAAAAKAAGNIPSNGPAELLAAAVTGWVLSKEYAEPNPKLAARYWAGRQFALTYTREKVLFARQRLVEAYKQVEGRLEYDEMVEVIRRLPPSAPLEVPEPNPSWEAELLGDSVGLTTPRHPDHVNGVKYLVKLPPGYHHGRSYPVLVALHNAGEKPRDIVRRLKVHAGTHGYVLVAPRWAIGVQQEYQGREEERSAVTTAIRDVKRRLNVDSDRVFLTGYASGGTVAFDVGVSHPDLFAGVVPMNGIPAWRGLMVRYWRNAQYLPFYVVVGGMLEKGVSDYLRPLFEKWSQYAFPCLLTIYKGRSLEWFHGEWDMIFDWMSRQKRRLPVPELGRPAYGQSGLEFRCMREEDARFYWIEAAEIYGGRLKKEGRATPIPARMAAKTVIAKNQINLTSVGNKKLYVWLQPKLYDPQRIVTVYLNNRPLGRKMYKPDLGVMMEDFYQRGDRQRLFTARMEVTVR